MPFQHDIAGGQGNLIVTSLQSPNFVHDVSGWQVAKDGSAEFNNLTIRGTFYGTDYIISTDGIFFYSGTPALGNLVLSIAPSAGTDTFGNPYPEGFNLLRTSASSGTQIGLATGAAAESTSAALYPYIANESNPDEYYFTTFRSAVNSNQQDRVQLQLTSSASDSSSAAQGYISYVGANGSNNTIFVWGYNGLTLYVVNQINAVKPGTGTSATNPAQVEGWHSMSLASGFTAGGQTPEYRLWPDNTVRLRGSVSLTATHAAGTAFWTCPAGYAPQVSQYFMTPNSLGSYALGGYSVHVNTSSLLTGAAGVSGNFITLDGIAYTLDS